MTARPAASPAPFPAERPSGGAPGRRAPRRLVAFDGGPGGGAGSASRPPALAGSLGMWIALAPLLMFFLSLASAYVVRRGLGDGWGAFPVPRILWLNTLILLASSVSMEAARRGLRAGPAPAGRVAAGARWIWLTLGFGLLFLGGQILAWRELAAGGIGVGSTPYGSYLYLMTGAHAAHLAGGLLALAAAALWPAAGRLAPRRPAVVNVSAIYWHFMDVVWLGLFILLVFWR